MSNAPCEVLDDLDRRLQQGQRKGGNRELIAALVRYEMDLQDPASALCLRGLSDRKQALSVLAGIQERDRMEQTVFHAENELNEYEAYRGSLNHRQARKMLETVIQHLHPYHGKQEDTADRLGTEEAGDRKPDAGSPKTTEYEIGNPLILARAYLYRSLLFRPKGFTVPARKIEALNEVVRLSRPFIASAGPIRQDALRLYLYAGLELQKAKEATPADFTAQLQKVSAFFQSAEDITHPNELLLLLAYAEAIDENQAPPADGDRKLRLVLEEQRSWERPSDLALFKARAAFRLGQADEVATFLIEALTDPPGPLADPFWEDLLNLLHLLVESGWEGWEPFALSACDHCRHRERKIGNNIYLAWHWSRMAELYQMAFAAEPKMPRKVFLVDALKSRPMVRYQALSEIAQDQKDEEIRDFLEQEFNARDGRYVIRPGRRVSLQGPNPPDHERLPEEWVAVHFFLEENGRGHAMSLDRRRPTDQHWQYRPFHYGELHKTFLEWQEALLSNVNVGDKLAALCKRLGADLDFLFHDSFLAPGRPVLWIPHGFLHRLPLHSAIDPESGRLLLANHVSRYLPSWEMFSPESAPSRPGVALFRHFPESKFPELEQAVGESRVQTAEREPFLAGLGGDAGTVGVLCHGKCDMSNPFRSRLLLADGNLKLQELLGGEGKVNGSRVLLGACESDMYPPILYPVDEHLSLSTVLLSGGAREVVAGLWPIGSKVVDSLFTEILSREDAARAVGDWQRGQGAEYRSDEAQRMLFFSAPFRVMGLPV